MSLPREVTDCIIDLIADDRQSLCAIAQVARVFVDRAHHHLFSTFHLHLPSRSRSLQAFSHLLRRGLDFPGIGILNHIRHFHIKDLLAFTNHAAPIFRLLSKTTRLQSVTLRLHLSFLSLDQESRTSLLDLCHSPHLNALTIYGLFDIPQSLLHPSHLKQIHLFYFSFLSYHSEQPKIVYQPESISTLSSQFRSVLDAIHAGGGQIASSTRYKEALACLKELNITVCNVSDIPLCLDAASFAGALNVLKLHMSFPKLSPKLTPSFPFRSLSNLTTLQVDFHQGYLVTVEWVTYIGQLLPCWTLPPSLEKLSLSFATTPVVKGGDAPICELKYVNLHSLDRILIQPPFCLIPTLTLTFRQLHFKPPPDDDHPSHFIPEHKLPLFTASRPGNFVFHVKGLPPEDFAL